MEKEISEVKIYSKSLRKCIWKKKEGPVAKTSESSVVQQRLVKCKGDRDPGRV